MRRNLRSLDLPIIASVSFPTRKANQSTYLQKGAKEKQTRRNATTGTATELQVPQNPKDEEMQLFDELGLAKDDDPPASAPAMQITPTLASVAPPPSTANARPSPPLVAAGADTGDVVAIGNERVLDRPHVSSSSTEIGYEMSGTYSVEVNRTIFHVVPIAYITYSP